MLRILADVKNGGKVLPSFTNLCISLRPLLVVLPVAVAIYGLWLWFRKAGNVQARAGFIMVTMAALIVFVFPVMLTCYWLFPDLLRTVR